MKALLRSFVYAWQGFRYCLRHERNMRIHLAFTLYMYSFLGFYDFFELTRHDYAVLFIANALVFMGELINTAFESTIDLLEKKYNKMAKIAKDTAAAAVLVGAFFAVAIGVALLWQPEAFQKLFAYYKDNPLWLAILIASLALSLVYILAGPERMLRILKRKPREGGKPRKNNKGVKS